MQPIVKSPSAKNDVKADEAHARAAQQNADVLVSVAVVVSSGAIPLEQFIETTHEVLNRHFVYYEVLLIDNGGPATVPYRVELLQNRFPNLRLLQLSRRFSEEAALAAALDHCIGDYVVLLNPAIHPPGVIPKLVEAAQNGFDCVAAVPNGYQENWVGRVIGRPLYSLANSILGVQMRPHDSTYKVFSRRLVNSIVRIRSKSRSLSHLQALVGLNQSIVYYEPDPALKQRPTLRETMRQLVALSDIVISNSAAPLRIASFLGCLASTANLVYLGYILAVTLIKSRLAEGWLTISLTTTTMFLLLFLIMAILASYIARILDESKEQPLYFVQSEKNSTVSSTAAERLNVLEHAESEPAAYRQA